MCICALSYPLFGGGGGGGREVGLIGICTCLDNVMQGKFCFANTDEEDFSHDTVAGIQGKKCMEMRKNTLLLIEKFMTIAAVDSIRIKIFFIPVHYNNSL